MTPLTALALAGLSAPAYGDLMIIAAGTAGDHVYMASGGSAWNTVPAPPSNFANVYWDADRDGVFGETAIGENSGNSEADLAFTAAITDGEALHFGAAGFTAVTDTGLIEVTVQLTDLSTIRLVVNEGTSELFSDSNGDQWQADFDFINAGYGDVVNNVSHLPGGAALDHQGVLTFTQVPEPGSLALLSLGGLAMLRRRRA
ncbi:MAG: PEP-CTERM sorting domain-containing protein [Phycisphaerales bacterium JB063]